MSRPILSNAGLSPTHTVTAIDEHGSEARYEVSGERPLTIYLNKREIVTLMTLGGHPEHLTLGYLKNQGLIHDLNQIESVQVDWETEAVAVITKQMDDPELLDEKLSRRTVTTGCGQGTVFGHIMEGLESISLPEISVKQSTIYALLKNLNEHNLVYRNAGAVHGCALCENDQIVYFVEDIGRHNAVDAIAGMMSMDSVTGNDKLFYTTGRLTSEMVIKVAQMGITALLSRSGLTHMGLTIARQLGITLIARAKGHHFLVYNGKDSIDFDAVPAQRPGDAR